MIEKLRQVDPSRIHKYRKLVGERHYNILMLAISEKLTYKQICDRVGITSEGGVLAAIKIALSRIALAELTIGDY